MGASWGHALHPPDAFAEYEVGVERVPRRGARGRPRGGGRRAPAATRVIVKVNIEGEECPRSSGRTAAAWEGVDELYVETHPWAACGADELSRAPRGGRLHPGARARTRSCLRLHRSAGRVEPLDVAIPGELALHGRAGLATERSRVRVVAEHLRQRAAEGGLVPRRDESHVLAVREPVARRDRAVRVTTTGFASAIAWRSTVVAPE